MPIQKCIVTRIYLRVWIGFCKNRPSVYAGSKQIPLFFGNGLATFLRELQAVHSWVELADGSLLTCRQIQTKLYSAPARHEHEVKRNANGIANIYFYNIKTLLMNCFQNWKEQSVRFFLFVVATSQSPSLLETLATAYNLRTCPWALLMIAFLYWFSFFSALMSSSVSSWDGTFARISEVSSSG